MMKKYLFAFGALALVAIPSFFMLQNNDNAVVNETEALRKKYDNFLENSPFKHTQNLTKEERRAIGLPPNKFNEREWELTMDPNLGRPTPELAHKLYEELEAQHKMVKPGVPGIENNVWKERGPNNIGGRVRAIIFDPNDSSNKRVIAAGVSGGIWINENITSSSTKWKSVEGVPGNLSVTCITVDPNNKKIMYAGTGEVYTWGTVNGNGVYKSVDGGNTWKHLFGGQEPVLEDRIAFIQDIIAWNNPKTNKTEIFFGTDAMVYIDGLTYPNKIGVNTIGVYRSTDGKTFSKLDLKQEDPIPGNSFDIDGAGNLWMGSKAYYFTKKGGGCVFKTTDGVNWTLQKQFEETGRVQIAMSKQKANKGYVLLEKFDANAPVKIHKTTDGFKSAPATKLPRANSQGVPANDFCRQQNFYNLVIAIDPNDDSTIYAGGIDLHKSSDSGNRWNVLSQWTSNSRMYVHADQHAIVFGNGSSSELAFGNDGGVYYSSNGGSKISKRNNGLNITQFYKAQISMSGSERIVTGAQDNGSLLIKGSSGINGGVEIQGGDGGYCFIDRDDEYMISSYVYNNFKCHTSTGGFKYQIYSDRDANNYRGDFITQAELDSKNDILYTNASIGKDKNYQIFKFKLGSNNAKQSVLKDSKLTKTPITFRVSPFDASKLFVGTKDGKILVVNGASGNSQSWSELTTPTSAGAVSCIEFGKTANDIFVTYHNWGVESIFYSADGGKSWKNKEGNLPNIPVKCILQNPLLRNEVIIGTELGVWATSNFNDANPNWVQAYNGMRDVKVMNFDFRPSDNTILATTFGRGVFTGKFTDKPMTVSENALQASGLKVFPTVSNGKLNVASKAFEGDLQVSVYALNGKRIYNQNVSLSNSASKEINLSGNASGMYLVNLSNGSSKITKKIIIE